MREGLPTKEELEALYLNKGREALVWYAWRSALRVLLTLGRLPFDKVWEKRMPEHVFNVCRVSLVLANVSKSDFYANAANANAVVRAANFAANNAKVDYDYDAAYDEARADAADAASTAARASAAIISDYNFLLDYNGPLQNLWFSQPLWPDTPPEKFLTYKETLFKQLKDIGLGFLANDLHQLFDMQGDSSAHIPEHWTNYAKQFSEIELNDPKTLRSLILGETEATEVNAVRMILLGPGGAGKTTLMDRLLGKEVIKDQPATVGIVHQQLPLDNAEVYGGCTVADNLQLFAWDFGGQTLFYGLHRSFLHENCVYVLVVDGRHEQSPDNWLYQICHLAEGKRTTVMLVSNRYENCQYQHNQQRLERLFGDFLELHFYGFAH